MHWSRWGDPAEAGPLSESAFALVDAFIGTSETPAVDPADVRLSEPLAARPARRAGRHRRGRARAHRPRHPAAPHPRQVDARPAQAPRRRRLRLAGRRRPPRHPRRGRGADRVGGRAPRRAGPVRWRYVGRGRSGRPTRGVRRRGLPRPDPLRPAARRRHRLDDRDPRAGPARPAGRGAAGRARADPGPLPAVLRVRLDRRLRGHPLLGPVLRRATAASTPSSSACASRPRRASSCWATPRPTPPAPTCARW